MSQQPEDARCELCGEPMPPGETMFKYHGYSGPCPKPPMARNDPEPPGTWKITAECRGGHKMDIFYSPATRAMAEGLAGLIDGSSPMYLSDPRNDPASPFGNCGICRAEFTCTVTQATESDAVRIS